MYEVGGNPDRWKEYTPLSQAVRKEVRDFFCRGFWGCPPICNYEGTIKAAGPAFYPPSYPSLRGREGGTRGGAEKEFSDNLIGLRLGGRKDISYSVAGVIITRV